nr:hypothetical protein [Tanacetum cinerariifolium]
MISLKALILNNNTSALDCTEGELSSLAVGTSSGSGNSSLAVGTPHWQWIFYLEIQVQSSQQWHLFSLAGGTFLTSSGNFFWQWELLTGSGNSSLAV